MGSLSWVRHCSLAVNIPVQFSENSLIKPNIGVRRERDSNPPSPMGLALWGMV